MIVVDCAINAPIPELGVDRPGIHSLDAGAVEAWLKAHPLDPRLVVCMDPEPGNPRPARRVFDVVLEHS